MLCARVMLSLLHGLAVAIMLTRQTSLQEGCKPLMREHARRWCTSMVSYLSVAQAMPVRGATLPPGASTFAIANVFATHAGCPTAPSVMAWWLTSNMPQA